VTRCVYTIIMKGSGETLAFSALGIILILAIMPIFVNSVNAEIPPYDTNEKIQKNSKPYN